MKARESAPGWIAVSPMVIGAVALVLAVAVSVTAAVVWVGVTLVALLVLFAVTRPSERGERSRSDAVPSALA